MNWMITMNIFKKQNLEDKRDHKDRRDQLYNLNYFSDGGIERRTGKDRRALQSDRRT